VRELSAEPGLVLVLVLVPVLLMPVPVLVLVLVLAQTDNVDTAPAANVAAGK